MTGTPTARQAYSQGHAAGIRLKNGEGPQNMANRIKIFSTLARMWRRGYCDGYKGKPNRMDEEPNQYVLCPRCQDSHHEDNPHTCSDGWRTFKV